ncbi:pyrroline-5-carboxylate reductase [Sediminibacillus dalangtanensis]|uniref:Pyrroline-5-carboxylate reductase n=1 Tax=Sediminibacillus dalangtanensis TaxID=2729421 RepID=A0ABX7VTV6_9BACI|nr:pyrroline-5-carboxylate reductase [Sediminibacillus dalangtanensis]QTM98021.1 pyrroline-5-carboxylate reductase [Sediminibacillus dalangtanensis]
MIQETTRILFIGAGRMAQAIIGGLAGNQRFVITASNNGNQGRLEYVEGTYGVFVSDNWRQEVSHADIILLAMPPETHPGLLEDLAGLMDKQLVITVAAGISPSYLEEVLPEGTPAAWVMPNTAAKLGESSTLYAIGKHVDQHHKQLLEEILEGIGAFEKVTEEQLYELTAITGSAPAFIYRIAESLKNQAAAVGISEQQARKLVAQMIAGSAEMLKTGEDPAELADQVATPGGSTAAGLHLLDNHHIDQLMQQAIIACREKSRQDH